MRTHRAKSETKCSSGQQPVETISATSNGQSSTPTATPTLSSSSASSTSTHSSSKLVSNQLEATGTIAGSKLVFGLSSRTNRLKHDEYAESRRQQTGAAPNSKVKLQQQIQSPIVTSKSASMSMATNATDQTKTMGENEPTKTLNIRASKYGNFYKPQAVDNNSSSNNNSVVKSSPSIANTKQQVPENMTSQKRAESPSRVQQTTGNSTAKPVRRKSLTGRNKEEAAATAATEAPITTAADQQQQSKQQLKSKKTDAEPKKADEPKKLVKTKKAEEPKKVELSKKIEEPKKTEAPKKIEEPKKVPEVAKSEAEVKVAPRMQFNIPPPPKLNTSASKSSVVSYAKSRIYDKPSRQILANPKAGDGSLLELRGGSDIPKSILSGFKPPKQVNVSKAREKWEDGEPFTRCKSRQRLAAQAGKKLLHGTWSMTSVVATQQLQLQQALAASSSPSARYTSANPLTDSGGPVKVLTRGSVLERVNQFERAPNKRSSIGSNLSGSISTSSLVTSDDDDDDEQDNLSQSSATTTDTITTASSTISSTSSASNGDSHTVNGGTEASITISANQDNSKQEPTSRQARYKNRVSSLQGVTSGSCQPLDPVSALLSGAQSPPRSPTSTMETGPAFNNCKPMQTRRASLRRRSSITNNSSANIPKFYHPNGKPNTYEIELQKKNIVACFDKFPERKALLEGPNRRRHFHSISLACGFSEYFKDPLCAYVKHQMTNSNLLHNAPIVGSGVQRKQSASNLSPSAIMNQISPSGSRVKLSAPSSACQAANSRLMESNQQKPTQSPATNQLKPLTRAASIDTSTMEKLSSQNYISCDQFLVCWLDMIGKCFDLPSKFVHLLTLGQRNYLVPDDFVPLIQSIIDDHPGLKFLRAAPDFHMRYIQTVIARIYFCINKSWTGKISINELRYSNLLAVLQVLSQEEDINQITDYFSYEHFYVIYCKFWNLDQDHDLLISKEDLARHNDAAISSRIIDRIFSGIVSKQIQKTGKMSYTDFVWFIIAEEDKKHPRSVEYWFRLMDIDGDGYISMYEMEYFYYEQVRRLELMNIEALPFIDSACQILDLVNPKEKNKISLSDLKKTKMATIFFDTFINLEKYLEHESREFVSTRDVVQDGVVISDWDRYASEEYENLVTEESTV